VAKEPRKTEAGARGSSAIVAYDRVLTGMVELLASARRAAARTVNAVMTATYWEMGRRIVEVEQGGKERAGYGEELLKRLSADLTKRFGRGCGAENLRLMRKFYRSYAALPNSHTLSGESGAEEPLPLSVSPQGISKTLSGKSAPLKSETASRISLPAGVPTGEFLQTAPAKSGGVDRGQILQTVSGKSPLDDIPQTPSGESGTRQTVLAESSLKGATWWGRRSSSKGGSGGLLMGKRNRRIDRASRKLHRTFGRTGTIAGGWNMRVAAMSLVCLSFIGCRPSSGPSSGNTPQQMFQYVILNPIPASVTNLQGVGDTWQGYSLYLRFEASKADIDAVIAKGYKPATWQSISYRFVLPPAYDRFEPPWNPEAIPTKECYEMENVKNGWTPQGTHCLVIDRSSGTVYFCGIGN
jgi:hypothetical protein